MPRPLGHRALRALGAFAGTAVAAGLVTGGTFAAWTARTASPGNRFSAQTDWTPPTIGAVVGSKGSGSDGYVRPGGTYQVYASVDPDGGRPPSGVKTVTSNASSLTTTATAAALTSGSWTLNGVTYNYRTGNLVVGTGVTEGAKTLSVTATDNAANQTQKGGIAVTVDGTPPATTDVQTANGSGGAVSRPDTGDKVTLTFSEQVEPATIMAGWTGASAPMTVRFLNGTTDSMTFYDNANTTQLKLGTVALPGSSYVTSTVSFTGSTMVFSTGAPWTVTITLGSTTGTTVRDTKKGDMSWAPLGGITDLAGNALPTTAVSERGGNDAEF